MPPLRKLAASLGALAAVLISLRLGLAFCIPALLFVITLAVVGKGNRLLWLAIFPVVGAVVAGIFYGIYLLLPHENEIPRLLLAFTSMSVAPGLVLYAATLFKKFRGAHVQAAG